MVEIKHDEEGQVDNFAFLNDIQEKKQNILATNPEMEDDYNPPFMNLGLSQSFDTIHYANEMNVNWLVLDKKMQHDYLFYSIRKTRNRKGKWAARKKDETVELLMKYYKCSRVKAKEYQKLLNNTQLNEIKEDMSIGGQIIKKKKE